MFSYQTKEDEKMLDLYQELNKLKMEVIYCEKWADYARDTITTLESKINKIEDGRI